MKYSRGIAMSKQWTEERVAKILDLIRIINVDSLDREMSKTDDRADATIGDFVEYDGPDPQELAEQKELHDILIEAVNRLPARQCMIIKLRYGLESGKPMTLEEIGAEYNVTRERIRQVEIKALDKLRHILLTKYKIRRNYL